MFSKLKNLSFGPATLVAAAFIGPGTVVTASLAGANFGYALLWALVFSVIATMILQEMAARLGVVTQQGLGEAIRSQLQNPFIKWFSIALVLGAVVIGNSVYQGGNLSGASLGMAGVIGEHAAWLPLVLGMLAAGLLWNGSYRLLERVLIGLVLIMSLAFVATFLIAQPDWSAFFRGMLVPSLPVGSLLTVVALIGTTVVPYNLFLHAASSAQKWQSAEQLPQARGDLLVSIPLGGLISIAIVSTAAAAFFGQAVSLEGAADLSESLRPLAGDGATWLMAIGLFAAGLSSSLTAPLASAYALSGILGYGGDLRSLPFRLTWLAIIGIGVCIASLGLKPVSVIWFAQVANGLLLPIMALFLVWACNHKMMGNYRNSLKQNLLAAVVVLVAIGLGLRSIGAALQWW
ncbi:Divalent metal cation transporter MntH [Pseudidiomarina piscicola]|uniref:Divalent metal cation transporter MntH n=1 Tax=Pseudidiomarina piscicola TaxID=2614830 RepID=A0A6S6WLQ2_9GAMM|nr:Nramp family divalent metal transporter [Pseudidiomarina piscicola]CAB0151727.1 Divalent metal cation transporter MntH [Pseudidiomarina piscicola]VZT41184.1 Divalent metal cation transporter MntH [Pseudomonas aeruginosa]